MSLEAISLNAFLLLGNMSMEAKVTDTGAALSHPEYSVYVQVTFSVAIATLIGYGLWLQRSLIREEAEWEASGWDTGNGDTSGVRIGTDSTDTTGTELAEDLQEPRS